MSIVAQCIGYVLLICVVMPFLWYFVPGSRSGFQTNKEAEEWGAYCLKRNKRIAPQICADKDNDPSWG